MDLSSGKAQASMSIEARHWPSKRIDYTPFKPVGWEGVARPCVEVDTTRDGKNGLSPNGLARKRTRTTIQL